MKPSEAEIDELLHDFAVDLHPYATGKGQASDYDKYKAVAKSKIQRMIVEAKGEPEVVVGFLAPGDLVNGKVWPTHCKIVQLNKAELERKLG